MNDLNKEKVAYETVSRATLLREKGLTLRDQEKKSVAQTALASCAGAKRVNPKNIDQK